MAFFPTSPANNATTVVNGITYIYSTPNQTWKRQQAVTSNVVTPTVNYPIVLNDITSQFTGVTGSFSLRVEQTRITSANVTYSNNLEVLMDGRKLLPFIKTNTYPWLSPYEGAFNVFRLVFNPDTTAQLVIYNTPTTANQAIVSIINNSSTVQTRNYPYSATTIALGD
jgi:hypothetical protein